MCKMTNLDWIVYGLDIDQPKLVILTNLFFSVMCLELSCFARQVIRIYLRLHRQIRSEHSSRRKCIRITCLAKHENSKQIHTERNTLVNMTNLG